MSDNIVTPIDKSAWGPGPWQTEPDRVEFEAHGLPCLIVRHNTAGHLCGYVAVPPGHPWHGKDDSSIYEGAFADDEHRTPEAHGGITYASKCAGHICHVPKPGESDDVWWLGFDAAHSGDCSPGSDARLAAWRGSSHRSHESYKTVEYMRAQCEALARQAAEVAS